MTCKSNISQNLWGEEKDLRLISHLHQDCYPPVVSSVKPESHLSHVDIYPDSHRLDLVAHLPSSWISSFAGLFKNTGSTTQKLPNCDPQISYVAFTAAMNVSTDLAILVFPMIMLRRIVLPTKQKVAVGLILATGSLYAISPCYIDIC